VLNEEMGQGAVGRIILLGLTVALLSSGGCSLFQSLGPAPPPLQEDFSSLRPEEFPAKIKQLEEISQHDTSLSVRTRALFYLALAHVHYKNPSPDYSQAVRCLDQYIALEPKRKDGDEIVAWKSVVQALDTSLQQHEKLKEDYALLKQQYDSAAKNRELYAKKVSDLNQMIENQSKEIESLKATIKSLDAVQQEIEKKRKAIKK
jgi:septal ring factor EnvC (AmiA/AmiB activator)